MKITIEKLEKQAERKGNRISIQSALSWSGSRNAAISWQQGDESKAGKMWAYSYFDKGYKAFIEPIRAYESLKSLAEALKENDLI